MVYREFPDGSPCKRQCPAGIDIPRYIRFISNRKYDEALAVVRERVPFPGVLGHVCHHPCEKGCQDSHITEPVAINALKRFVADRDTGWWKQRAKMASATGKHVAIVGSGPAGLTVAYYLAKSGHKVTVLESLPVAGGMMRVGIPEYRLPRALLASEVEIVQRLGVDIKTNTRVSDADRLLDKGYDAVLLAIGTHRALKLGVPGEDSSGVIEGLPFLRDVNLGLKIKPGNRVAVVGGGNVAVDAARTSKRLGAREVRLVCLESREEMPAHEEEIQQAIDEGVILQCSWGIKRITEHNKKVSGIECMCCTAVFDSDRRFKPTFDESKVMSLAADTVIVAIGQAPDSSFLNESKVQTTRNGRIEVESKRLETGARGIFTAGDAVSGPSSVVEAIASGRQAAISIDRYLGGSGDINEVLAPHEEDMTSPLRGISVGRRTVMPKMAVSERLSGFGEVEIGFDEDMALREANRCLWCDLPIMADTSKCTGCLRDALMCSVRLQGAANPSNARIRVVPPDRSSQPGLAEISFADDCDGCGICVATCPYGSLTRSTRARSR